MIVRSLLACVFFWPLVACSGPEVKYKVVSNSDGDLPNRSVRFTLQGTAIALGTNGTVSKAPAAQESHGPATAGNTGGAGQGTLSGCGSKVDWTTCVQGMSAAPALVAAEDAEGSKHTTQWTFIATPNSSWWGSVTDTYSLSSTPVGDDETLPKTITVTWTDNLKTILTTTGTGAATGLMFGPIGGAVGAGMGLAAGVISSESNDIAALRSGKTKKLYLIQQRDFLITYVSTTKEVLLLTAS